MLPKCSIFCLTGLMALASHGGRVRVGGVRHFSRARSEARATRGKRRRVCCSATKEPRRGSGSPSSAHPAMTDATSLRAGVANPSDRRRLNASAPRKLSSTHARPRTVTDTQGVSDRRIERRRTGPGSKDGGKVLSRGHLFPFPGGFFFFKKMGVAAEKAFFFIYLFICGEFASVGFLIFLKPRFFFRGRLFSRTKETKRDWSFTQWSRREARVRSRVALVGG